MEPLHWKDDFSCTCPYCGERVAATIYLNTETLECNSCEKEFYIQLQGSHELSTYKM